MARRKTLQIWLTLLALFLIGTVVVLSSISYYLTISRSAYITEDEVPWDGGINGTVQATNRSSSERIPRIIHQTWKTSELPDRWKPVSKTCRDLMPDYEYMLWTDQSAEEFIAKEYPWFSSTFKAYTYNIQRADAIRYFVLHHFGGIYIDLDVGCLRRLDPLLQFPIILPKTIPVGVSNDLMFAEREHPFIAQTIHNLVTFDHSWILNYPTVMFSTGPMFLSAQMAIYSSSHPSTTAEPGDLRVLPKILYGKNAKPGEAPHSFFSHHYGSSWHADDAGFITFLGKWGKALMWVGLVILSIGLIRLFWYRKPQRDSSGRRLAVGGYEIILPRIYRRNRRYHIELGNLSLSANGVSTRPSSPLSLASSEPPSPSAGQPFSFDVRPGSPTSSDESRTSNVLAAFKRAGTSLMDSLKGKSSAGTRNRRGVLFFLPAIFTFPNNGSTDLPGGRRQGGTYQPVRREPPIIRRTSFQSLDRLSSDDELEGAETLVGTGRESSFAEASYRSSSRPTTPGPPPGAEGAKGSWGNWVEHHR